MLKRPLGKRQEDNWELRKIKIVLLNVNIEAVLARGQKEALR